MTGQRVGEAAEKPVVRTGSAEVHREVEVVKTSTESMGPEMCKW